MDFFGLTWQFNALAREGPVELASQSPLPVSYVLNQYTTLTAAPAYAFMLSVSNPEGVLR